jgi:hypothetical protein
MIQAYKPTSLQAYKPTSLQAYKPTSLQARQWINVLKKGLFFVFQI